MLNFDIATRIVSIDPILFTKVFCCIILILNYLCVVSFVVERPYRVPIPDWAAILFVFLPCIAIIFLCAISSYATYAFSCLTIGVAMALHVSYEFIRNNRDVSVQEVSLLNVNAPIIRQDSNVNAPIIQQDSGISIT